jgi:DNA-3-methyladenine glycosylase
LKGIDFMQDSSEVARRLIGMTLLVGGVGPAKLCDAGSSLSYASVSTMMPPTPRNAVMFGPPGHAYVYLSYGIHWCLNFVCREAGHGAGVLIRALEPTTGVSLMIKRRRQQDPRILCAGPGRLAEALAITRELNGKCVDTPPFSLTAASRRARVLCGPRIGISKAVDQPWRFGLAGSHYVSRPFRN